MRAVIALIVTLLIGVGVEMVGATINVSLGSIVAIAVMGAFIIHAVDSNKK